MRRCSPSGGAGMRHALSRCRGSDPRRRGSGDGVGDLDAAGIDKVEREAWPEATSADELPDALMLHATITHDEVQRTVNPEGKGTAVEHLLNELMASKRVT